MAEIFYPGCRVKRALPEASEKLAGYMRARYSLEPVGCCKADNVLLKPEDTAVLICNNCAKDLVPPQGCAGIRFVFEMIGEDGSFPFPDYGGLTLPLQDCGHGYAGHDMEATVRSLLSKMNICPAPLPIKVTDGMSYAEHMAACRANFPLLSGKEVLVYCNICRKAYADEGYAPLHLLNLLFGIKA